MTRSVTVLLPTFRRPRMLARALRSLQAQTFADFSVLVCDNSSGDGTASVVADFARSDPRIAYHCHPGNIGPQANFGWAFSRVDGEFFCLFSDDDILLPGFLAECVAGLRRHPEAMAWCGEVIAVDESGPGGCLPLPAWPEGFSPPVDACDLVCRDIRPQNTGTLFRSSVLDGGFHPVHADFHASDVLWTLHAAAKGGIGLTRVPVAVFTRHAGSTSTRAGGDPAEGIRMYWPSVRYLHDHFPPGRLSGAQHAEFLRRILATYGIGPLRRLGRVAATRGRRAEVATCLGHLEQDLHDEVGARRLRRLAAIPAPLLRLYYGLRDRLVAPWGSADGTRGRLRRLERDAREALALYDRS